jgi:hypothetical protein
MEPISAIIVAAIAIIPAVLAGINQARNSKKSNKIIVDSLKENYQQTSEIKEKLLAHIDESVFERNLRSTIQTRAYNIIALSKLPQPFVAILKLMARQLEALSFRYYYSKYRKIDYEMSDFLDIEFENIKTSITRYIKFDINLTKKYKYSAGKVHTVSFLDFFLNEDVRIPFKHLDLLKVTLIENGFDEEDGPNFIDTMDEYTKVILLSFIDDVHTWNNLSEYKEAIA